MICLPTGTCLSLFRLTDPNEVTACGLISYSNSFPQPFLQLEQSSERSPWEGYAIALLLPYPDF